MGVKLRNKGVVVSFSSWCNYLSTPDIHFFELQHDFSILTALPSRLGSGIDSSGGPLGSFWPASIVTACSGVIATPGKQWEKGSFISTKNTNTGRNFQNVRHAESKIKLFRWWQLLILSSDKWAQTSWNNSFQIIMTGDNRTQSTSYCGQSIRRHYTLFNI